MTSKSKKRKRHFIKAPVQYKDEPDVPCPGTPNAPSPPSNFELLELSRSPSPGRLVEHRRSTQDLDEEQGASDRDEHYPKNKYRMYVGNLPKGQVSDKMVKDLFRSLFKSLPAYMAKYDKLDPVVDVQIGKIPNYAFVELSNEELCQTALKFQGAEVLGKKINIGRTYGNGTKQFEWRDTGPGSPGLDVSPLQKAGILPMAETGLPKEESNLMAKEAEMKQKRQLYVGNLNPGLVTPVVLREVLGPACLKLMEYNSNLGSAIVDAHMFGNNTYSIIEFQSESLASRVLETFNGMDLMGRPLDVKSVYGRPAEKTTGFSDSMDRNVQIGSTLAHIL